MNRTDWRQLGKGLAFTSPWLVGFALFTLLPAALSLYFSFNDYNTLKAPVPVGLDNYRELWNDAFFWAALRRTLFYAALALPAGMLVSLALALLLNIKTPGQSVYRVAIFLPAIVPLFASAMLWLWLLNGRDGPVNALLRSVGVAQPPTWLDSATWALPAIAYMSLWGTGYTVVIYLAALQDVPRDLYEAAEIDGAGFVRRLFAVTLPMISPVIFFNLITGIIGTVQVFAQPFIMTGGGPNNATKLLTQYLFDVAFRDSRLGYASTIAWVQLLLILMLTGVAFWSSRRWVHYQGKT